MFSAKVKKTDTKQSTFAHEKNINTHPQKSVSTKKTVGFLLSRRKKVCFFLRFKR